MGYPVIGIRAHTNIKTLASHENVAGEALIVWMNPCLKACYGAMLSEGWVWKEDWWRKGLNYKLNRSKKPMVLSSTCRHFFTKFLTVAFPRQLFKQ